MEAIAEVKKINSHPSLVSQLLLENLTLAIVLIVSVKNAL